MTRNIFESIHLNHCAEKLSTPLLYLSLLAKQNRQNKRNTLQFCVSSLRRGHANLLCIVPILVYVQPKLDIVCKNYSFNLTLKEKESMQNIFYLSPTSKTNREVANFFKIKRPTYPYTVSYGNLRHI